MAEEMARVFISFVHEDQRVAEAVQLLVVERLNLQEGEVFLSSDKRQVTAGENWFERITRELGAATVLLLMLSRRSVRRPWVNFEAGAGWLARKTIVPVCYGNLTVGNLPKPYSDLQALDLSKDEGYLMESIAKHLGLPKPQSTIVRAALLTRQKSPESTLIASVRGIMSVRSALETFVDE